MHFYDELAPYYHLVYRDWDAAIASQAESLARVIREHWGDHARTILDVSCGIGTQAIGLASLGFSVTASDLSPAAIGRARSEAKKRGMDITFSVCDMRHAHAHYKQQFDVVISCDNSITHLLSDQDIAFALRQMYLCTKPGGGCLLTVRNYDAEERGQGIIKPYGTRDGPDRRYVVLQVWDFEGDQYDLAMYFVEDDRRSAGLLTHVFRARYYAISPGRILELMASAGFVSVHRLDDRFYQPVLIGTKAPA
jgi:SAM-dependent methyltransferase